MDGWFSAVRIIRRDVEALRGTAGEWEEAIDRVLGILDRYGGDSESDRVMIADLAAAKAAFLRRNE